MKQSRASSVSSANGTRKRTRRNEDTLIADLQAKIAKLQERKERKAMRKDPALKLADKLLRQLKKAERTFADAGRIDLANSVKAAAISLHQTAAPAR
jgi:uncharacterized protein YqeY